MRGNDPEAIFTGMRGRDGEYTNIDQGCPESEAQRNSNSGSRSNTNVFPGSWCLDFAKTHGLNDYYANSPTNETTAKTRDRTGNFPVPLNQRPTSKLQGIVGKIYNAFNKFVFYKILGGFLGLQGTAYAGIFNFVVKLLIAGHIGTAEMAYRYIYPNEAILEPEFIDEKSYFVFGDNDIFVNAPPIIEFILMNKGVNFVKSNVMLVHGGYHVQPCLDESLVKETYAFGGFVPYIPKPQEPQEQ